MKRWVIQGILLGSLLGGLMPRAEASAGGILGNIWSYLFSPVNCVGNLAKDIGVDTVKALWCVVGNANRNPATLTPLITTDGSHTL